MFYICLCFVGGPVKKLKRPVSYCESERSSVDSHRRGRETKIWAGQNFGFLFSRNKLKILLFFVPRNTEQYSVWKLLTHHKFNPNSNLNKKIFSRQIYNLFVKTFWAIIYSPKFGTGDVSILGQF